MTGSSVLIVLIVLAAIVGFCYLFTKFSLLAPVIAIEGNLNPLAALKRSWQLTKGNSLRLFLFYALLLVAIIVVAIVFSMIVGLVLAVVGGQVLVWGQGIVASALNAAWATLFLAILAGAHRQLAGTSTERLSETFE
jgi:membrane-anchored glycerophosphoryl diester phosphodiesterase (GDPDase)